MPVSIAGVARRVGKAANSSQRTRVPTSFPFRIRPEDSFAVTPIHRRRSAAVAQDPDAKSEVHEDFGMYSYDRALKKIVLRQFHTEGFVNEYTLDSISPDGRSLEFATVRIENIAAGWRAKEAYRIIASDEVVETFSLPPPGKDFAVYSETRLKRAK
jgi:hypothetical protein